MKVNEIMTKDLTACEKDVSVRELIFILESAGIPSVAIVDDEDRVVGYISERDLIQAALPGYVDLLHTTSFIPDLNQIANKLTKIAGDPIEKYMRHDVLIVHEDDDDMEAAELILRKGLKSLPVVNADGQLVGQVRRIDLLRHLL